LNQSELQKLFLEIGIQPSRKLGQNFLVDQNLASWIVRRLAVAAEDTVVEVGAGAGALSRNLLPHCENLILIEFDRRLAEFLRERLSHRERVAVLCEDACRFDPRMLFPRQPVRLIGNLPYSAAGEIIRNFLGPHSPICEAVLMVQREVAERMAARPRTKDYGLLTLRLQARWKVRILKHLPPHCFFPRPQVESTVVHLTPRPPGEFPPFDLALFDRLLRQGFAQRRKQLRKGLQIPAEQWEHLAQELDLVPTVRAEELDLSQWIELTNRLDPHPLKSHAQKGDEMFDVVDESDRVVGQERRDIVHRDGLLHRAVHLFVFNPAGELFLQKRSRLKDVHPGAWDSSAAGHLDTGEDYETAARRELEEELGILAEVEPVAQLPPSPGNGFEFVHLFRAETRSRIRWPASEIEFGQFFPLEIVRRWVEARPQDFAGGFLECWKTAGLE